MTEEREGDDLIEPFPVPGTDDVWSEADPPERAPEGIEGEEH
jgi:hypothetical protein